MTSADACDVAVSAAPRRHRPGARRGGNPRL